MRTHVVWFRRDLRVADHEALAGAGAEADAVVCLFVLDPVLLRSPLRCPARLAYLADALAALAAALQRLGGRLVVRRGDPARTVVEVAREAGAEAVHCSADHTTYARRRDRAVALALERERTRLAAHPGVSLHPPSSLTTAAGTPYRVFTPFRRAWLARDAGHPLAPPPAGGLAAPGIAGEAVPDPAALGVAAGDRALAGGEKAAGERLERFLAGPAARYHTDRDLLATDGTSRLSADLHYGCLSPRQVLARLRPGEPGHDAFATQLAWRDFALHVMAAWPEARTRELDPRLRALPWAHDPAALDAWREGRTGFPVVDAGMRQLAGTAWMHNRARLITASFLCKDLLVDWRHGEAVFLRRLVDGDVASNNLGWQWVAGTGTDPQPYFRVLNPTSQGKRYDPDGAYVRRHVPELAALPARWVHEPWRAPPDVQRATGFRPGADYPPPMVDHTGARERALAWYRRHRSP